MSSQQMSNTDTAQVLDKVMHEHFGINKRDTTNLLKAAEIAPDECLQNHQFQDVMNSLIQVS